MGRNRLRNSNKRLMHMTPIGEDHMPSKIVADDKTNGKLIIRPFFTKQFVFSNFWKVNPKFEYEGRQWLSSEHAYMFQKGRFFGCQPLMNIAATDAEPFRVKKISTSEFPHARHCEGEIFVFKTDA
ncbi:hypothetical protein M3Y96_00978000 [Aphelenchoides besseyi]|nr:hypothetical protein M3Y96_00978000 [Aphelenchoides besseyi]